MVGGTVYTVDFKEFLNNVTTDFGFSAPYFGYTRDGDVFKAFVYVQYKPINGPLDHHFHTFFGEHTFEGEAYRRATLTVIHEMRHHLPIHLDDFASKRGS